tara:strand:+ start:270 stop:563 length:294 start_codon:yes stop_codon:yes gene_type:complete
MVKKTTKKQEIKFTQEDLDSLQNLKDSYSSVELSLGRLEVQRLNLEKNLDSLADEKLRLETEYENTQKREIELITELNEKYGAGNLNPETGVFTPTK